MTRDRDIERVLDRFYAEGPTEMPDRVLLGVLDRIERVPQRRLALLTRFATMNTNLRLAAAAAIVVAVVGVGAFALSQRTSVGPPSTASPVPTAGQTVTPSLTSVPAALQFTWLGATRTVPQITPPIERSVLRFAAKSLSYLTGTGDAVFLSTAGQSSPSTVDLTLTQGRYGCAVGDVGSYTFTLSGSVRGGGKMTLVPVADACAARSAAISGDWVRANCTSDPSGWCLGDLDPGTYGSMSFNPFVATTAWTSDYGALTYTVPAGWTNTEDCDYCFTLVKQNGPPDPPGILMFSDVAAHSQDAACPEVPQPGVAHTAAAIAAFLKGLPGLIASAPVPITIGGLNGMMLDISMAPSWTRTCSFGDGGPVVTTLTHASGVSGFDWNVGGTVHERVILLDSGGGRTLLIEIDAPDKAAFDALVAESMPVINSFQFKP